MGHTDPATALHDVGEDRLVTTAATRPSTMSASGIGHHQCSQKAATPWMLTPDPEEAEKREPPPRDGGHWTWSDIRN